MTPLIEHTERAIFLEEGDVANITLKKIEIHNNNLEVTRDVELVDLSVDDVKKGGFPHYMLKEIYEQPQGIF